MMKLEWIQQVMKHPGKEVIQPYGRIRRWAPIEETVLAGDVELDDWTLAQIDALLKKREEELAGLEA